MRQSNALGLFFLVAVTGLMLIMADAAYRRDRATDDLDRRGRLVAELGLTDLALFTEARYTRHLT